jgi:hypothetical protein
MTKIGGDREAAWRAAFGEAAKQASVGTGLVYELYVQKVNSLIEGVLEGLPERDREEAQRIAIAEFSFLESGFDEKPAPGECQHFLDPYWCPAGCGDVD